MNKSYLPYDVYERHKRIAQFIKEGQTVLDVGGELNHLSQFVNAKKIIVANLNTGDIIIKKSNFPFGNNSYDIVCSIDVLEHIHKNDREKFIKNLIRVAKDKVLISFPVWTRKHEQYEKDLIRYLQKKGEKVTYLSEHVKNGLPKIDDIKSMLNGYKHEIYFSGNIMTNELLFKLFIFDPRIKLVRKIIYVVKLFFNLITNPLFFLMLARKSYSENVNRAYVIIHK